MTSDEGYLIVPISSIKIGDRIRKEKEISGDDLLSRANSIKKVGLLQPIVVRELKDDPEYKYELLAGLTRLLACRDVLKWKEIKINVNNDFSKSILAEVHENTERRDFSPEQLHKAIKQVEELKRMDKKQGLVTKNDDKIIADEIHVPENQVRLVKRVYKAFNDYPLQPELISLRKELENRTRKLDYVERHVSRILNHMKGVLETPPRGKFDVIIVKPALRNNLHYTNKKGGGVTVKQLSGLPINELAADDAVLAIWTTGHRYDTIRRVVDKWTGFSYKNQGILSGESLGQGLYFIPDHELLLVYTKGNMRRPLKIRSSKLDGDKDYIQNIGIYEILEEMYPDAKYLNVFGDVKRPGWTNWSVVKYASSRKASDMGIFVKPK